MDHLRDQLDTAQGEVDKLESKCDQLLEQKRAHLDKIASLQKQVDTLMASANVDSRLKGLITNIESQRDAYKHQVQNLIKDLQNKDPNKIIVVETQIPSNVAKTSEGGRRTIVSDPRPKNDRRSAPDPVADKESGDLSLSLELLSVRARLAETSSQLETARREIVNLRQDVEGYKQQLQQYTVKQTQTSTCIGRRKDDLASAEAVNDLKRKIVELEKENIKLRNEK